MKKSKDQHYCHCFIVCMLVPYASWFSYLLNMVTILISTAFIGAGLVRGEALISMWISKGAAVIRGRRLFETRRLLEGIR